MAADGRQCQRVWMRQGTLLHIVERNGIRHSSNSVAAGRHRRARTGSGTLRLDEMILANKQSGLSGLGGVMARMQETYHHPLVQGALSADTSYIILSVANTVVNRDGMRKGGLCCRHYPPAISLCS